MARLQGCVCELRPGSGQDKTYRLKPDSMIAAIDMAYSDALGGRALSKATFQDESPVRSWRNCVLFVIIRLVLRGSD